MQRDLAAELHVAQAHKAARASLDVLGVSEADLCAPEDYRPRFECEACGLRVRFLDDHQRCRKAGKRTFAPLRTLKEDER